MFKDSSLTQGCLGFWGLLQASRSTHANAECTLQHRGFGAYCKSLNLPKPKT